MQFQEFTHNYKNTFIYGCYKESKTVKGVVVLVHGMGEHSGRYMEHVVPALVNASMAVVMYDNVGHGKSSGKKGHCDSYEALLDILEGILGKAQLLFPEKPLFLYGHSMGGNLVLNYALRRDYKLQGIIATSPFLKLAMKPPKWKMVLGKLLLGIWPSITLPSELDANGISRIPDEVSKYVNDPLVHDMVSPMFSLPIIDAGEWSIAHAHELKTKTLLLHGTEDPIIDYQGTVAFYENTENAELKLFEGGRHELHYDVCREEMLAVIQNWLRHQL